MGCGTRVSPCYECVLSRRLGLVLTGMRGEERAAIRSGDVRQRENGGGKTSRDKRICLNRDHSGGDGDEEECSKSSMVTL
jgi:hypothetical protein